MLGFTKADMRAAIGICKDTLTFYGSSVTRGVTFQGLEILDRRLKPKKSKQAFSMLYDELTTTKHEYHLWFGLWGAGISGEINAETFTVKTPPLTIREFDLYVRDLLTGEIEKSQYAGLGYGWIATYSDDYDFDAVDEGYVKFFEQLDVSNQEKRKSVYQSWMADRLAKVG